MIDFNNTIFLLKNRYFRKSSYKSFKNALLYENFDKVKKSLIVFDIQKQLVAFAYNNTVFYKNYYDSKGFHPDMLVSEKDWAKVPILEKEMIRQHTDDFIANGVSISELNIATTGGSTGKPLKVYKDKSIPYEVLTWRTLGWWGVNQSANHGVVNRSVPKTFIQKIRNYLLWWPTKRIFLDASSVSEENISRFVSLINKKKIKFLVGYCGSLEKIADFVSKNKIVIEGLKVVWSTTSPLAKPIRTKMEKAFQCPIMDQYGSVEVFHIAVQKPNENYLTVNSDYVHVDIVDSNNCVINETQEMGDVLVTDLHSVKFPLIKYRLGDRSRMLKTMQDSEDGFPKIDFVKGRISDIVSFNDGSYIDGAYLTTICDGYDDVISRYQIYQDGEHNITFRIVLVEGVLESNKRVRSVINNFSKLVNNKTEFNLQFLDSIPDDRGKRRFIISDVKKIQNNS